MNGRTRGRFPSVRILLRRYLRNGLPPLEKLEQLPVLGPRFRAIRTARLAFLNDSFLDTARDDDLATALEPFLDAVVPLPVARELLRSEGRWLRHGLAHLLRCPDPLEQRVARCLNGPYAVPGLGRAFWSALAQSLDWLHYPGWTPGIARGLHRLGLVRSPRLDDRSHRLAVDRLRRLEPTLTALHVDHFLTLAASMTGRDLDPWAVPFDPLQPLQRIRQTLRSQQPLRRRMAQSGEWLARLRRRWESALTRDDAAEALDVLSSVDASLRPESARPTLLAWGRRFWTDPDPLPLLSAYWAESEAWGLPTAVLHLRQPERFPPWTEPCRRGFALLADDDTTALPPTVRYRLDGLAYVWLRDRLGLHPLEAVDFLTHLAERPSNAEAEPGAFRGFCPDTFAFLRELNNNNCREWMAPHRERFRFVVNDPLRELAQALAERYVEPILRQTHGWDVESRVSSGGVLSRIVKNDFGRSTPYCDAVWATFYRREMGKRHDIQWSVRLGVNGLSFGLRIGSTARIVGRHFREQLRQHADACFRSLQFNGALTSCRFGHADDLSDGRMLMSGADLLRWTEGPSLTAGRVLPSTEAAAVGDELVGEVMLTFEQLLPLFRCAIEQSPQFERDNGSVFGPAEFRAATFLSAEWLERTLTLLHLKRQLILQGVPGTGKTHVARCLARLLTGDRSEAVRFVQFHPAYSYEEFVEGIRPRSIESAGRHEVIYPIENGLLFQFAAEAERSPKQPHVLIIDEINRGHLPRIFGELLFALEYRDQAVTLPCSRREFRLPSNLFLIATMNAADRSTITLDHALRRRFSFVDMPPSAEVLHAWLRQHPPAGSATESQALIHDVVSLFTALNAQLEADAGPDARIGPSVFMVPLDAPTLEAIWEHHILPTVRQVLAHRPDAWTGYQRERLLARSRRAVRGKPRIDTVTADPAASMTE